MTDKININFSDDPHYRYKMPAPILTVHGKGRNTHTIVQNYKDICLALHRDPRYILQHIKLATATPARLEDDEKLLITAKVERKEFISHLRSFIEPHVLCPNCHHPETEYVIGADHKPHVSCKACGYAGDIPRDKTGLFIIRMLTPSTTAETTERLRGTPKQIILREVSMPRIEDAAKLRTLQQERGTHIVQLLRQMRENGMLQPMMRLPLLLSAILDNQTSGVAVMRRLQEMTTVLRVVVEASSRREFTELYLLLLVEAVLKPYAAQCAPPSLIGAAIFNSLFSDGVVSAEAFNAYRALDNEAQMLAGAAWHKSLLEHLDIFYSNVIDAQEEEESEYYSSEENAYYSSADDYSVGSDDIFD